jgi:DNA polymerase-4
MAMQRARRCCPPLVVVPGHFDLYEQFSHQILGLCEEATPLVEPAGVGAAWLDLTGTRQVLGRGPVEAAEGLRRTVREWLRVSISAGVATNKTVARIAARLRKPGAQIVVAPGKERDFLAPLPLRWLPGVGPESSATLEVAGMRKIGELARAPLEALGMVLGRGALGLQRLAQGVDEEPVRPPREDREPKFAEVVEFPEDVWEERLLAAALRTMLERVMTGVRAAGVEVRRLTLRLRYTDRDETERSVTAREPTAVEGDFYPLLAGLLRGAWTRRVRLRGMTLRASRVYRPSAQMTLFEGEGKRPPLKLALAIDELRRAYGEGIVCLGDRLGGASGA